MIHPDPCNAVSVSDKVSVPLADNGCICAVHADAAVIFFGFCRTHQSFLVNMKHVTGVERYQVTLENGTEINISKKYYKKVEAEYIRQQGEM